MNITRACNTIQKVMNLSYVDISRLTETPISTLYYWRANNAKFKNCITQPKRLIALYDVATLLKKHKVKITKPHNRLEGKKYTFYQLLNKANLNVESISKEIGGAH